MPEHSTEPRMLVVTDDKGMAHDLATDMVGDEIVTRCGRFPADDWLYRIVHMDEPQEPSDFDPCPGCFHVVIEDN